MEFDAGLQQFLWYTAMREAKERKKSTDKMDDLQEALEGG